MPYIISFHLKHSTLLKLVMLTTLITEFFGDCTQETLAISLVKYWVKRKIARKLGRSI